MTTVAGGATARNRVTCACLSWVVVGRPLTVAARRGNTANRMLGGRLPARACSSSLRCCARQAATSVPQLPPGPKAPIYHRLSSCWDAAAAGTCQHALVRWAQHTRCHRLPGRSLRLWAAATASRQATPEFRVAAVRRVHGSSGDRADPPSAEAPIGASLFSPGQFKAFVKRYGPVALGTIHVAVCYATLLHLKQTLRFGRYSCGDGHNCICRSLSLCADGFVDPASAHDV